MAVVAEPAFMADPVRASFGANEFPQRLLSARATAPWRRVSP